MEKIRSLVDKAQRLPCLAHIYSMEVDRELRAQDKEGITFSALEFAEHCMDRASELGFGEPIASQERPSAKNVMYQAEQLVKAGKRSDAIAHAFSNARGPEVSSLNIFYANHATQRPELRLRYLNKYLRAHGLHINLEQGNDSPFFYRLGCDPPTNKIDGPLVTVIMPAYNAERTIELAVGSLLNQTWQNLQIIIVDDSSTDTTLKKAKDLAKPDPRVEVLSNRSNVGPYVCRNLGMLHARGQWLTVHDADDWAFPDRIERQVQALAAANALACTGRMLRMNELGQITRPAASISTAEDGYLRLCFVSLMVQTAYFRNALGAWDSVRVAGDAEMIDRVEVMGTKRTQLQLPLMICLDHQEGLTNHQEFGLSEKTGKSQPLRADYKDAFTAWHGTPGRKKMHVFGKPRPFEVSKENMIEPDVIKKVFANWTKNLDLIKASELFDATWYKSQYPEFVETGLEAAEHYLVHGSSGATDPGPAFSSCFYLLSRSSRGNPLVHQLRGKDVGPNPNRVLLAAAEVAKTGAHERGVALAEAHLPPESAHTLNILKANAALANSDEARWREHLNAYLAYFGLAPISLDAGEGTVFDRLNTAPLQPVREGPLITVIMPAWNAEKTVRKAAQSILNQTWRNLELLIADDASTDQTWAVLNEIAASDARVRIFRNRVNVGPYVSKNIALRYAMGEWITGFDADDWSFPQRLERQFQAIAIPEKLNVNVFCSVRLNQVSGEVLFIGSCTERRRDGVAIPIQITAFFNRKFLIDILGGWDSVRFGGDSELLGRAKFVLRDGFKEIWEPCMFYIDTPNSLTNNPETAYNKTFGLSPVRAAYRNAWQSWQSEKMTGNNILREFPPYSRPYEIPEGAAVPLENVLRCVG